MRRDSSPNLPTLSMSYWGPCVEAPTIISPPSDTYGPMGANLTLDCEARGYPAPIITWQYENVEGQTFYLPSDDQDISIQMRGGPEANMVTGWALRRKHVGLEDPVEVGAEGATYLGCRQVLTHRALPDGRIATGMEWAMEKFHEPCLEK